MLKPERLARETLYDCPWFTLHVDRVRFPNGHIAERYHVLDFPGDAACALVTDDAGRVLLVQAYRYPIDAVQWEAPAGGMEPGESPEEAALREAREESGHACADPRLVYSYHPMNGLANDLFHIVRARATDVVGGYDENEVAGWRWFTRGEVEEMLDKGELRDGFTLVALLLWLRESNG